MLTVSTLSEDSLGDSVTDDSTTAQRAQPTIVELINVSKWAAPARLTTRSRQNDALQSLIELCVALWQAKNLSKGVLFSEPLDTLLDDLSLQIPAGCVVGVVDIGGRSRTAFLKVVGNVQPPSRGEVRLYGRAGSVAQAELFSMPHRTCRINFANSAKLTGLQAADIDAGLERIPSFSGLGEYLDVPQRRLPKWVSSDLAISLMCCLDLDLLITEEVSRPVSDAVKESWSEYLRSAPEKKKTVVLSGKRVENIIAASTHLLLIDKGRIRAFGPTQEICADHMPFLEMAATTVSKIDDRFDSAGSSISDEEDEDLDAVDNEDLDAVDNEADHESVFPVAETPLEIVETPLEVTETPVESGPAESDLPLWEDGRTRLSFEAHQFHVAARAQGLDARTLKRLDHSYDYESDLCRLMCPERPLFRREDGGNIMIPVQTFVPNLQLRPELELSLTKQEGPVLRIRARDNITVSDPSLVMLETPLPPHLLANERYAISVGLTVVGDSGPPRVLGLKDSVKFRVRRDDNDVPVEPNCDLHGSASWEFERCTDEERTSDTALWFSFAPDGRGEVTRSFGGIPIVSEFEELRFSTSLVVGEPNSEVSASLDLATPASGTIRYALPTPEKITEPGQYSVSVVLRGKELGPSLFRVTMTTLTRASAEARVLPIRVQCDGCLIVSRETGPHVLTAGKPAAMELDRSWNVRSLSTERTRLGTAC